MFQFNQAIGGNGGDGGNVLGGTGSSAVVGGSGASGASGFGGGLYIDGYKLSVLNNVLQMKNVDIKNNIAQAGSGGSGGAVHSNVSTGVTAGNGGAVGVASGGGMYVRRPQLLLYDGGEVSGNVAQGGNGGNGGDAGGGFVSGTVAAGFGSLGGSASGGGLFVLNGIRSAVQLGDVRFSDNAARAGMGGSGGDASYGIWAPILFPASGGPGGDAAGGALAIQSSSRYTEIDGGPLLATSSVVGGFGGPMGSPNLGGGSPTVIVGSDGVDGGAVDPLANNLPANYAVLGGTSWKDTGISGDTYDGLDTLLPNILVTLIDVNGRFIGQTYTDSTGSYSFATGYTGDASLRFGLNGVTLNPVVQDFGADDALDSDIDTAGDTALITVAAGMIGTDIDAGFDVGNSAPRITTLNLTVAGTVSNNITRVTILTATAVPIDGAYTITVSIPVGAEYVDMVSADENGNTSIRRIYIDMLIMGGG